MHANALRLVKTVVVRVVLEKVAVMSRLTHPLGFKNQKLRVHTGTSMTSVRHLFPFERDTTSVKDAGDDVTVVNTAMHAQLHGTSRVYHSVVSSVAAKRTNAKCHGSMRVKSGHNSCEQGGIIEGGISVDVDSVVHEE